MCASKQELTEILQQPRTLTSAFYKSEEIYKRSLDLIFARSWQWLDTDSGLSEPGSLKPVTILPGSLNEPVLLSRDEQGKLSCLSNVCTHRGARLIDRACTEKSLRCRYHGRRFSLCGTFQSAPGFEEAPDFPQERDNLPELSLGRWQNILFSGVEPAFPFAELVEDMERRLAFLPLDEFRFRQDLSRDYTIDAHWALYVDNYLEGLHIPFVHPNLAVMLDLKSYRTELQKYSNLQVGIATKEEDTFQLPESSPDFGQKIGAYYYWLFPNLMLNFYPWGLSVNIVSPQSHQRTKVRYLTYVWREEHMGGYSPDDIAQTESEDQDVVQLVQAGMQSRHYHSGRYSPTWERGVQHFHQLVHQFMGVELNEAP